ncbi:HAMP domain-containing sensor histidine kinase [Ilumatobacter sp.]|uniref:HAMP domain-containing sensor histidine kinase n=1 Tax=Ilumatobacter sp. TaxID=1967498 RepID=UPI003AF61AB2
MSLRWKIALAMAGIAAVTAIAFGSLSYRSTRDRLYAEIDRSLAAVDVRSIDRDRLPDRGPLSGLDAQVVGPRGNVVASTFPSELPVSAADLSLLGVQGDRFSSVGTDDGDYRVRTIGLRRRIVQVGRSLDETDRLLASLRNRTAIIAAAVTALAAVLGLWLAGRVTASLRRLTSAAEVVETTGRLDVETGADGNDEVGRLGEAFDRMLAALARSKDEQRRLVEDAGHELRTPLTSLRTNLDALRRYPDMSDVDREAILVDLHAETGELSALVDEVVAVGSGTEADEPPSTFDLAVLVGELAERFERRTSRSFVVSSEPSPITAQRSGVQRAVSCLMENATKFDQSGGSIDVTVGPGTVTVADRGIGITEADLTMVFDRFHRSDEARTMPGSGLGLSIVREVARRHGGEAFASNRDGGGAVVGFRLGPVPADA